MSPNGHFQLESSAGTVSSVRAGGAQVEWMGDNGPEVFVLDADRTTIGKGSADLVIHHRAVSRLHAVVERVTGGWVIQDLGSRNGTFVNGIRVLMPRALRSGDEIRFGTFGVTFRAAPIETSVSVTAPIERSPQLTRREHDALVALCRPILAGSILDEPASISAIAGELVVSDSAAKKLLTRVYNKYGLSDADRRRGRLAAEAMRRGAVSIADLEPD